MSIRPVDLQVMLPRTAEISRSQANEGTRQDVAHQQFSQQLQKEAVNNMQTVNESNKTDEQQRINDEEKNKQRQQKKKKEEDAKKNQKKNPNVTYNRGDGSSLIDISI